MITPTPAFIALCLLLNLSGWAHAQYAGSAQCAGCHQEAYQHWQQSHHWQSMQPATDETVVGDFNNTSYTHGEVTSTFYRKDGQFLVRTDNAEGALEDFDIAYTFGFYPLQQYLIGFDDGRYQALSVAWDSRPASEGGQRWFHLYPDEAIPHDDPLHWTGAFQNWNSRCASCHSTDLKKNYDQTSDSYQTSWSEINVGCEACHGPGTAHLEWAAQQAIQKHPTQAHSTLEQTNQDHAEQEEPKQGQAAQGHSPRTQSAASPQPGGTISTSTATATIKKTTGTDQSANEATFANKGLTTHLAANARWQPGNIPTRHLESATEPDQQLAACGGCHARRQELSHAVPGVDFLQQYSPSLLLDGLYFADGQINDEVYVYGSFVQSKMHAAGVVCSNCHEPHSLQLRAEGNALCSQCHDESTFDNAGHHHHPQQSTGAQCVNCHMPARDYMVVDPRRDHSFRIPQPVLSELFGTPNACTGCHQDQDDAWAKHALQQWYGHQPLRDKHAATLTIARSNHPAALEPLLGIIRDEQQSAILRATAVQESGRFLSTEALATATEQLYADDGLIRLAAVRTVAHLPPPQRLMLLEPLIADPVKAVRIEVADALSPLDLTRLSPAQQSALNPLFDEYITAQRFSADMPSAQLNLGTFYSNRGEPQLAEQAYRHALKLSPGYLPGMLNLADLYRDQQRDDEAKPLLQQAIAEEPQWAPAQHAMGLLLVRQQKLKAALPFLQQAAELSPETVRYRYVYGVALHGAGKVAEAIAVLSEAAADHPQSREIQGALKAYQQQAGGHQ